MKYFNKRLDANRDTVAVKLLPIEFTIDNFEGCIEVVEWVSADLPDGSPGQSTQGDYDAQAGAEFLMEVELVGSEGGFALPLQPDGKSGYKFPCDCENEMKLKVKLHPKNRAYVKFVTHDGCEFISQS